MNNAETVIRFENASFGYPSVRNNLVLVDHYTGEIKKGELSALIGRNGTGKSTILKSMVKLIPLLSGKIYLNNLLLNSIPAEEFPRLISFVSTEMPRNPVMTVYELVSLGRFPFTNWLGSIRKNDHIEIMNALQSTGMVNHSKKSLYQISDGERQRAMIARTLAQNTPVIILDEPTAFLDLPNKYELISLLAELSQQGRTIIFSTHDTGIALRFPDKLLILNENTITSGAPEDQILNGTVGNIFQSPGFTFSRKTGDIEIKRRNKNFVSVNCEDPVQREWTLKALKRAGFGIREKSETFLHIEATEIDKKYNWKIKFKNSEKYFESLYELNFFLNHIQS
jgi:iron complex transport system ATP-binding protein